MITTKPLPVVGASLVSAARFDDVRGYFSPLFDSNDATFSGNSQHIQQVSQSSSKNHVIRGLHYQYDKPMQKLIRVLKGAAIFYLVDLRPRRLPRACPVWMSGEVPTNFIFVPDYCAVGFQTVDYAETIVEYFHNAPHNPSANITIAYDDPDINIQWHPASEYILSEKDKVGMSYKNWLHFIDTHDIKFAS